MRPGDALILEALSKGMRPKQIAFAVGVGIDVVYRAAKRNGDPIGVKLGESAERRRLRDQALFLSRLKQWHRRFDAIYAPNGLPFPRHAP